MSYLLKGGLIATFTKDGPRTLKADVLIESSTITKIEENLPNIPGVETIDCTNKWITPGMVDTHRYEQCVIDSDSADATGRHLWMTILRAEHDKYADCFLLVYVKEDPLTYNDYSMLLTEYLVKNAWCAQTSPMHHGADL